MASYWLGLLLLSLALVLFLSPLAAPLVAPGFVGARLASLLDLTRVMVLMAVCVGASRLLAVVLHADRRFALAGLSEVAFQGISTAWLVAFHENGIASLAWAQVAGGVAQLLVVAYALRRTGRSLRPALPLSSGPARRFIRLSLPTYLGDSGDKLNLVVTRSFGSLLPVGGVAALQYAYMPVEAAYRTIAGSLATALFPFLSRRFAAGDLRGARSSLARVGVGMTVAFAPLAVAFWLLADVIVVALFERGSFDAESAAQTASALRLYAPSSLALALNELIGSSFHARMDTLTPMRAGFVRVGLNTLLCAGLTPSLGLRGLAAATTLSLFAKLLYLGWALRGLFSAREMARHLRQMGSVLLAAGLMGALVSPAASLASTPAALESYSWTSLLIIGVLCLGGYAAALWMVARRQVLSFLALLRHAIRRRRGTRPRVVAA
jgi:putative peptidoglycan lipid II flippase